MKSLPKLLATSVVRGSQQGESHGGIYLVDFEKQIAELMVDWDDSGIDFTGRGWDRGLRGIEFSGGEIFIAASDEIFVYDLEFKVKRSYKNLFLRHAHEINKHENLLFITSTGYDSILVFDLDRDEFTRGIHLRKTQKGWKSQLFDPQTEDGPQMANNLHLNNVRCSKKGLFTSGLRTDALIHLDSDLNANEYCSLPQGTHNARPFRKGVIFNDTQSDCVRAVSREGEETNLIIPKYEDDELTHTDLDDSRIARQGFARGLCLFDQNLIAVGSSPSTISLFDLEQKAKIGSVNLSMDIRNAIHGLEVWPYEGVLDS
jgi:WD40 repeat protein